MDDAGRAESEVAVSAHRNELERRTELAPASPAGSSSGRYPHIPDGYLSLATCAVGFAVAVPIWAVGARRVNRTVKTRQVPTLALLSAMCFLIMTFNVPIPDGTTAHAVGGALVAVLLEPWTALIAVSVALAFQERLPSRQVCAGRCDLMCRH